GALRSANLDSRCFMLLAGDLSLPFDHNRFPALANSLLQVILSYRTRQCVTSMLYVRHGIFLGAIIEIRGSGLGVRGTKPPSRNSLPWSTRGCCDAVAAGVV